MDLDPSPDRKFRGIAMSERHWRALKAGAALEGAAMPDMLASLIEAAIQAGRFPAPSEAA